MPTFNRHFWWQAQVAMMFVMDLHMKIEVGKPGCFCGFSFTHMLNGVSSDLTPLSRIF